MVASLFGRFLIVGMVAAASLACVEACSSMGTSNSGPTTLPSANTGAAVGGAGNNSGGFAVASSATGGSPAEQKVTINVDVPQASQNYIYAANPDQDTVSVIKAADLSIQTVAVDAAPHGLKTIPNQDAAVVVNTGSSTVSVLRTANSVTQVVTQPVMTGSNVVSIAPDGMHALTYYDSTQPTAGPPTDSPKDVSALDLTQSSPVVYQLTVGYHPSSISFSADSKQAIVVSDDGISIIDLQNLAPANSRIINPIPIYDTTTTTTANVTVTPNGLYAVANQADSSRLRLVDLAAKHITDLDLATLPVFSQSNSNVDAGSATVSIDVSDVQVAPDGSFLLAVVRDRNTVLQVPIPSGFDDIGNVEQIALPDDVITGASSIGPDGHYAVLFTTVTSFNEPHVSILDLTGQYPLQTINLHKIVSGVTFDPTGTKAYVLHAKSACDPTQPNVTPDEFTACSYGYSVIDLATTQSMLELPLSQPGPLAALPDGSALFILFASAPWQVQRVNFDDLSVGTVSIESQPTGIGFVASVQQVFVSQAQTDGRITFIDWTNLTVRSVAGYELNSGIWE